ELHAGWRGYIRRHVERVGGCQKIGPLKRGKCALRRDRVGKHHHCIIGYARKLFEALHSGKSLADILYLTTKRVFFKRSELLMNVVITVNADRESIRIRPK